MTKESQDIRTKYMAICTYRQDADNVKAYSEFDEMLHQMQPEPETLVAAAKNHNRDMHAIELARNTELSFTEDGVNRLFHGSGIIMLGSATTGELLAADYQLDANGKDKVDEIFRPFFGPYQRVAALKLGQAALLFKLGAAGRPIEQQYELMQSVIEAEQLNVTRHYSGYANSRAGIVSGASGMLPSIFMAERVSHEQWFQYYVADAIALNELESAADINALAGWWDYVAANITLSEKLREPIRDNLYPSATHIEQMNLS